MDPATALFNKAVEGNAAAAPVAPAAAEPQGQGTATSADPAPPTNAAPPATGEPEGNQDATANETLALLESFGIPPDRREAALKVFNDAKSKNGRTVAEENRRLSEELTRFKAQAEAYEQRFQQFEPLLKAVQPKPEAQPDPITSHPLYKQAIEKGYDPEQINLVLVPSIRAELRATELEKRLQQYDEQRAQVDAAQRAEKYVSSLKVDESHPVPFSEVEPLLEPMLKANPALQKQLEFLGKGGASPEDLVEFLYASALARNPALAAKAVTPPAPPAQAPGKATAAPFVGSAPALTPKNPTADEAAKRLLEITRAAR